MLGGDAGQAVTRHSLQVGLQFAVPARDGFEKPEPDRASVCDRCSGDASHEVAGVVQQRGAAAQIDHGTGRVQ